MTMSKIVDINTLKILTQRINDLIKKESDKVVEIEANLLEEINELNLSTIKIGEDLNDIEYDVGTTLTDKINQLEDEIKSLDLDEYATKSELFSKDYNDLTNKPNIPTVPTNISAFNNDSGYITNIPSEYITESELTQTLQPYNQELGEIYTWVETDYAKKTELFSGDYNDLSNKPTIPSIEGLASEQYVDNKLAGLQLVMITQAEYDALETKDPNTLYIITE